MSCAENFTQSAKRLVLCFSFDTILIWYEVCPSAEQKTTGDNLKYHNSLYVL